MKYNVCSTIVPFIYVHLVFVSASSTLGFGVGLGRCVYKYVATAIVQAIETTAIIDFV